MLFCRRTVRRVSIMSNLSDQIEVSVIQQSVSPLNSIITTFKLRYHRYIHSELRTHRLFSMNSASSRAIPIERNIEYVLNNPATPTQWGKNQRGMTASAYLDKGEEEIAKGIWHSSLKDTVESVKCLSQLNVHKQIANRLLEPYMYMNTILTAVDLDNFFYLRRNASDYHEAQPEIALLAEKMYEEYKSATPQRIEKGQWHIPFIELRKGKYYLGEERVTLVEALKISSSMCAQVSYRKEDASLEKATRIWEKLVEGNRLHGSALEHCASPIILNEEDNWKDIKGISHVDSSGDYWSGNFRGWLQYRKLFDNEAVWNQP